MKEAIRQAKKARALEEVPIGCVIVSEGRIIARGYNRRNTDKNTLSHAELNAIRKASRKLGDWRLEGCTMYVTLEPCQMCAGALVQSRIDEVVIGNLIDNAVESCEKVPKEQQFIRLYIGQFKEQLYISVSNATNETVRKLDEEYITHKRGNHGHGLKRINLIVEKYDGFINRKNEAGVFVTEIMLPL